jgi:hypothetical protein
MEKKTGLELLRELFPVNLISKLPKGTKAQNSCPANEKVNCKICGGWHHPKVIHLDYVGHAALTDRLLDADPLWTWEPFALKDGLPAFDISGGLWIKLTVCGHTRIGYGHAEASSFKEIGSREKEVIGDALRNAAMRFGAALDLWHKGDLHIPGEHTEEKKGDDVPDFQPPSSMPPPQENVTTGQKQEKTDASDQSLAPGEVIVKIKEIDSHSGETKGNPWTIFAIVSKTGDRYGTFDAKIADLAKEIKEADLMARIQWEQTKKGKQIISLITEVDK